MGIVRNGRIIFVSTLSQSGLYTNQTGNFIKGGQRARYFGGFDSTFSAYPSGGIHPNAFIMPLSAGSIRSESTTGSSIIGEVDLIPARNLSATSSASIVVTNAQLDQIVSLIASAMGAMSVNTATLAASISMQASSGGSITVDSALIGAIISSIASASSSISGASSTLTAEANMIASAGGPTELSPEGLASAILDALLADHNLAGTVGEALNNVGASGNPWASDLATNNNAGSFGERIQKLLTKNQFLGLK